MLNMKNSLKITIGIMVLILLILFHTFFYGFLSFLNAPLNNLFYGQVDRSCNADSDCVLRSTTCDVSCACPIAVNKNWNHKCWFGYKYPTAVCEVCAFGEPKCVNNMCELIIPRF